MTRSGWLGLVLPAVFLLVVLVALAWVGPLALAIGWSLLWLREKWTGWRDRRRAKWASADRRRARALALGSAPVVYSAGRLIVLAVLLVVAPGRASAEEPEDLWRWTALDTAAQATVTALSVVDWMQTISFTRQDYAEGNPILGKHPSRARVNTLVPLAIIGHAVVARLLPKPCRQAWQLAGIWIEADAVRSNYVAGVMLTLPWR